MLFLLRPSKKRIQELIARQRKGPFSYPNVGATRDELPRGYVVLQGRIELGRGSETYVRAQQAIRNWKMFEVPGVVLCEPNVAITENAVVAIAVKHFGIWSLNFCRIVYVVNENGPLDRWGFAYGTLHEHFESGEERFTVEWDHASELVSYEIFSFSRPGKFATWLVLPLARRLQRRFLRESLQAMKDSIHKE